MEFQTFAWFLVWGLAFGPFALFLLLSSPLSLSSVIFLVSSTFSSLPDPFIQNGHGFTWPMPSYLCSL